MTNLKLPWQTLTLVIFMTIYAIISIIGVSFQFEHISNLSFSDFVVIVVFLVIGVGILFINYYSIKGKRWAIKIYTIIFFLILIIGIISILIPIISSIRMNPTMETIENISYFLVPVSIIGIFLSKTSLKNNFYSFEIQESLQTTNNFNLVKKSWQKIVLNIISLIITVCFCLFITANLMMGESFGHVDIWEILLGIGIILGAILFTFVTINIFQEKEWSFKFYYLIGIIGTIFGIIFDIYIIIIESLSNIPFYAVILLIIFIAFPYLLYYLAKNIIKSY